MRIWAEDSGFVFCDHGRMAPNTFAPQVLRRKQVLPRVGSRFPLVQSLGSATRLITFVSSCSHASVLAAESYVALLHDAVPSMATVGLELDQGAARFRLSDCCISFVVAPLRGVRTQVRWSLCYAAKARLDWWIDDSGAVRFFDGVGAVNAAGTILDGHVQGSFTLSVQPPPVLGDYQFSHGYGLPVWYDGAGWITATGSSPDWAYVAPAPDASYVRPVDPAVGDMDFDQALWIPIWWSGNAWINATGAEV